MKNIIIMGSGRSGTSMTTGAFANNGYFLGPEVFNKGRVNNPYGNFEDRRINLINEILLEQVIPGPEIINGELRYKDRPIKFQRWLGRLPLDITVPMKEEYINEVVELTANTPFCFKDPRFSYTLSAWLPYLRNSVYICVFREPHKTVQSILKQIEDAPHLHGLELDITMASEVWKLMYGHILHRHKNTGEWLFIHYNQVVTKEGQDKIEAFTGATIDRDFPKKGLRKEYKRLEISSECIEMYKELCSLAKYVV